MNRREKLCVHRAINQITNALEKLKKQEDRETVEEIIQHLDRAQRFLNDVYTSWKNE